MLVSLALTFVVAAAAGAQDAPPTIRLVDGDVPIGPASVDTSSGERFGRLALANHFLNVSPAPSIDPLGCNDALLAAASLTLAAGGSVHAAAYLGTVAAAFEVQRVGNHPITADFSGNSVSTMR